jgi:hypothetical protein
MQSRGVVHYTVRRTIFYSQNSSFEHVQIVCEPIKPSLQWIFVTQLAPKFQNLSENEHLSCENIK